ncbi:MAG: hypothetical protein GWN59_03220 [Calditrichae bacterium]|nr:hypothetical protein [Calditrichia bacterium]
MKNVFIIYMAIAVASGVVAYLKRDYFSRGFFIGMFTSLFGLIAIAVSPASNAKSGDENDEHDWPRHGGFAVLFTLIVVLALIFV